MQRFVDSTMYMEVINEIVDGDWYVAALGIWRKQVRDGEQITIVGDGEQRRDFTHVVDICGFSTIQSWCR